jgi:hypothetical protein
MNGPEGEGVAFGAAIVSVLRLHNVWFVCDGAGIVLLYDETLEGLGLGS